MTLVTFFIIFSIATTFASFYFILLGAWPVSVFLFADFILLYLAFIRYNRESKIYDRIILKKKLLIINVERNGSKNLKVIDPTWLRLKIYSDNRRRYLSIISRGKSVKVGRFLNIKELEDLAKLIKKALIEREKVLPFTS